MNSTNRLRWIKISYDLWCEVAYFPNERRYDCDVYFCKRSDDFTRIGNFSVSSDFGDKLDDVIRFSSIETLKEYLHVGWRRY